MSAWTTDELRILRENGNLGIETVALMLGRSEQSVRQAAKRYRISLRKTGSRSGLLLGQPRSKSWKKQGAAAGVIDLARLEAIREEALAGELDLALLEQRILDAIEGRKVRYCPSCLERPVERGVTGLCEPCHLRHLARAHRDEASRRAARRDLDAARQEKLRSGR